MKIMRTDFDRMQKIEVIVRITKDHCPPQEQTFFEWIGMIGIKLVCFWVRFCIVALKKCCTVGYHAQAV